ncbi:PHD and RING finger domain-containing protein 1-like [Acanthochromis polyacanthus]|uniref:PHD and RING finger domain-containing protein 1-like n=1 Tax=Acanthochromis polyacanthus TaxID=80966 RepID=UPI0022342380|nr:PHD and RING finger domain-containing protein 1-like [Acanthochromis polyacanthus]
MDQSNAAVGKSGLLMSDLDKCYICLSPFEQQTVGSLDNCQHVFCLECIQQWSQTANTCPVDRISFAFIYQRQCPGGDVQKEIKVIPRKQEEDDEEEEEEEEESNAVVCEECGLSDQGHQMLVCSRCDSGYHVDCLTPPFNRSPEGFWICPECVLIPYYTGSTIEEEISDGELADLLADVDEASLSSSRLRPVIGPSSSAERRRSARIQSRASRNPSGRSQS